MITSNRDGSGFPEFSQEDAILKEIASLAMEYFPEFNGKQEMCQAARAMLTSAEKASQATADMSESLRFSPDLHDDYQSLANELVNDGSPAGAFVGGKDLAGSFPTATGFDNLYAPVVEPAVTSIPSRSPSTHTTGALLDVQAIRRDFPILSEKVNSGKNLVWLDNSATTQKPKSVIDRICHYYLHENSNVHRAAHELAARSTDAYEEARQKIASFLHAPSAKNIVFVRGTTEGINLVARSHVRPQLSKGDEIIVSMLEHHANIVPWQQICSETGARIRVIPVDSTGQVNLAEYRKLFSGRTKFVSVTHVSNALGTITPVAELVDEAHRHGVRILVDAAQSASHIPLDVQKLGMDFLVFSGHKIYGPTGIGAVYGKADALEQSVPYQGGGNMIADVTFSRTLYQPAPARFEAGTGNIADAVGLGAALDYVTKIGMERIFAYEHDLLEYALDKMKSVPKLRIIGSASERTSVLSFVMEGRTVPEVGAFLSQHGIAVRAGHHCAQPILRHFGVEASVRPSLAFYNTKEEIDFLVETIRKISV